MNSFRAFAIMLLIPLNYMAQEVVNVSKLKLEDIMKGNEFIGHQPENPRWNLSSNKVIFDWNKYNQPGNSTYAYSYKTDKIDSVTYDFHTQNALYGGIRNSNYTLFTRAGNLYAMDIKASKISPVLETNKYVFNIQTSGNSDLFYFQIDQSFYSYDTDSKAIKELANFNKGTAAGEIPLSQMEEEELFLFEYNKIQKKKNEWNGNNRSYKEDQIPTINYDFSSISNVQISGSAEYITFRVNDYPNTKSTHVDHHISEDGHTYPSKARAKVSDKDPNHMLGIYDFRRDSVYYVDFSTLPGIRQIPNYRTFYGDTMIAYEQDRNIIMHKLIYSEDGINNVIDIRSYDNKDRWIASVNLYSGAIKVLEHQHDEAWIGGPGISNWNMVSGVLGWLHDGETFYFQSEESGYSHLYTYNIKTKEKTQLTFGDYEIYGATLSEYKNLFYITANKTHPGNRNFYHLNVSSKELIPILTTDGNHEVIVSPDERKLIVSYSYKNKPTELFIGANKPKTQLKQLTHSLTSDFKSYEWHEPDVITLKDENDKDVFARLYEPEKKNGAAVIFVHGAGYLQNAHNYWSGYYREYMFHNMLRDNGYTVLDIDYRASKGYGRDHRTAIYRHMGGADLEDHLIGRKYLIDSLGIDENRVGIYGGSYGGFITLMALLTKPGKFKAGAAIRSVTDWFHYNHEYTSNILNYPGSDPQAYKQSSPIYFAEGLADRLLILHGMVDDNVQYQDVVRLSQRFIELGKTDWEMAGYPVEPHGFKITSSWVDEYRRIYNLFYEELILQK